MADKFAKVKLTFNSIYQKWFTKYHSVGHQIGHFCDCLPVAYACSRIGTGAELRFRLCCTCIWSRASWGSGCAAHVSDPGPVEVQHVSDPGPDGCLFLMGSMCRGKVRPSFSLTIQVVLGLCFCTSWRMGKRDPVAFASRSLATAEHQYSQLVRW